jgi:hypothetical protein
MLLCYRRSRNSAWCSKVKRWQGAGVGDQRGTNRAMTGFENTVFGFCVHSHQQHAN